MKNSFWDNSTSEKSTFFCFTPVVMLITFFIEIALALYVFLRYRLSSFGRLVSLIILILALFQISEYQMCSADNSLFWARIGFVLITLLPALVLHLTSYITGKKHFLKLAYTLAATFIVIFLFAPKAITGAVCAGNYILFQTTQALYWTFGAYYFIFLFLGVWEIAEKLLDIKKRNVDTNKKYSLWWLLAGYLSFLLPMGIIYTITPETWNAIPSIMCGFAIILAFILAFKIAPLKK